MKKQLLAAVAVSVLAILAVPTAAFADYDDEPTGSSTTPEDTATSYVFDEIPNGITEIEVYTDGPGSATIQTAVLSSGTVAVVDNVATAKISFSTIGVYSLYAVIDGTTTATHTVTVTPLVPADAALGATGFDAAPYLWFGGGLVVLGAALISVLVIVRRQRVTA